MGRTYTFLVVLACSCCPVSWAQDDATERENEKNQALPAADWKEHADKFDTGEEVSVRGLIDSVEIGLDNQHVGIQFAGTLLRIKIAYSTSLKISDIEELPKAGDTIVATGILQATSGMPELVVSSPQRLAVSSAHDTENGRLVRPPVTSNYDGKEIALLGDQCLINVLLVVDLEGAEFAGQSNRLIANAIKSSSSEPMQISYAQDTGDLMQTALDEVVRALIKRYDGWPRGVDVTMTFQDKFSAKDGPSAAVATALLIEGLVSGIEFDEEFAVTGDMNSDLTVQKVGAVEAKLRGAKRAGCRYIAIPAANSSLIDDIWVMGRFADFLDIQIFAVENFEQALELAKAERGVELQQTLDSYNELVETAKSEGIQHLSTPAALDSLRELLYKLPYHLNARILLQAASNQAPTKLSVDGSLDEIFRAAKSPMLLLRERGAFGLRVSNADELVRESLFKFNKLRPKLNDRTLELADSYFDFLSEWKSSYSRLRSSTSHNSSTFTNLQRRMNALQANFTKLMHDREAMEEQF